MALVGCWFSKQQDSLAMICSGGHRDILAPKTAPQGFKAVISRDGGAEQQQGKVGLPGKNSSKVAYGGKVWNNSKGWARWASPL